MSLGILAAERGFIPDGLIRWGIRGMLRARLAASAREVASGEQERVVESLRDAPIALSTELANEQHYELPSSFFDLVLGQHRKYSCCLYEEGVETLDRAEAVMLKRTCERAAIENGQRVLDLGCGWGSLSLWMAERFPDAHVTAVSNSNPQRLYIEARKADRRLENIDVVTADMNVFAPEGAFDRVVSVEMFEHMRNHHRLMSRIAEWLEPGGALFVHLFCHREYCYPYVAQSERDWMARHFFTDGMMPSFDLMPHVAPDTLELAERWQVDGKHYCKTCMDWLRNMDAHRPEIAPILAEVYGEAAPIWWNRWRLFFLACAELFRYNDGREWFVGHYRFDRA